MGLNCCKPRRELPALELEQSVHVSLSAEDDLFQRRMRSKLASQTERSDDASSRPKRFRNLSQRHLEPFSISEPSDLPNEDLADYSSPGPFITSPAPSLPSLPSLPTRPSLRSSQGASFKTSSWGEDLNNCSDKNDWRQADWRRAERSHINAPTISAPPINAPPISEPPISAPRINFISESEPISMKISTKESGKRDTGSSQSIPSLPEVKTLFDDGEMGDERKMFKLHKKSPELPSHNSNKGLLESRNTDYFSATTPGLLDGKREFESHKYTKNIEGADNKSMLYQASRPVKSSHLEKPHELNTYEIYYKDGKELEINKKLD